MRTRDFDELIAEALTEEEQEFLAGLEEPSMMQQGLDLFRGQRRSMNVLMIGATTVFLGLGVYCLVQFLGTSETSRMLRWGAGFFFCFAVVSTIKVWSWMEMQSNSIRREIKRVELQLASLAHRIDGEP